MMSDIYSKTKSKYLSKHNNHIEKTREDQRERKRNILYLILSYLNELKLDSAAESLRTEAQLNDQIQVCENIDLDIILQEYQSYYYTKFQKYPKIVRKLSELEISDDKVKRSSPKQHPKVKKETPSANPVDDSDSDFHFEIISLDNSRRNSNEVKAPPKALCEFENYSTENREMLNKIVNQIVQPYQGNTIKWNDCVGLDDAIEHLKESTVYPIIYKDLFSNFNSWKGILLYGPPGTGKTLLAKALANENCSTFFNVTSSTFISKWRGESEKMLKHLFDVARESVPSTIFFDEIDAVTSKSRGDFQHEASKRFESELLIQFDGILQHNNIFVLATTNNPWNLDNAILRRFDKRIYVKLPNLSSRVDLFKMYLREHDANISEKYFEELARLSENYTGSDIKIVCKEVIMQKIRLKIKCINNKSDECDLKKSFMGILFDDVKKAIDKVKPATSKEFCRKYDDWTRSYGSL